eukprot:365471-Chlamydomonas_euryale.AAC.22
MLYRPCRPALRDHVLLLSRRARRALALPTSSRSRLHGTLHQLLPPNPHPLGVACFVALWVLQFDGTCVWCGVSARSNAAAATQLAELLRPHGVPVAAVRVSDPHGATLHLKSVVSTIAPRHVLAAGTPAGRLLVETAMSDDTLRAGWAAAGAGGLQVTYVPDAICANVLRIGGHVVMQKGAAGALWAVHAGCFGRWLFRTLAVSDAGCFSRNAGQPQRREGRHVPNKIFDLARLGWKATPQSIHSKASTAKQPGAAEWGLHPSREHHGGGKGGLHPPRQHHDGA